MNFWNPKFPVAELPVLNDRLKRRLCSGGLRRVSRLADCTPEKLHELGYSASAIGNIQDALRLHKRFVADIFDILVAEGLTEKTTASLQVFDLLSLPLTTAQLGYLLRWQQDVGGRYSDKEIYCVVGGRIYFCTDCPYRDSRSNFCSFCYRKVLEDNRKGVR